MENFEELDENEVLELNNVQGGLPFESTNMQTRLANRNTRIYAGVEFNPNISTFVVSSSDNSQSAEYDIGFVPAKHNF